MKKIVSKFAIIFLVFSFFSCGVSTDSITTEIIVVESSVATPESTMVNEVVYPHDKVVEVNIVISTVNYQDLIANALDEEYYSCDITYNGYTISNVAIRTKGNSSLRDVVQDGDDRFSYNIDLNYYENQDLFGIDKIILNNIFKDPTMMAEYLTYEALDSIDAVSSRTTFIALSINGEYYGLYLSVEQVGNEFLDLNFGNSDNELYKPDNGVGSNLDYVNDNFNYSGLIDKNSDDITNEAIINLMEQIEFGENLSEIFNIDSYLKYLAVSTYTINLDSYQSGIYHNYYLYNNNGIFEWIAWDLNMAFNGFPKTALTDAEAIGYLIDEPTIGSMNNYPLIQIILADEDNLEQYHVYLQELIDGYFNYEIFNARVLEIHEMIKEYVEEDNNSFYTYTEYENALFNTTGDTYSLLQFVAERNTNVQNQLTGVIPSTNNGQGNGSTRPTPPRR